MKRKKKVTIIIKEFNITSKINKEWVKIKMIYVSLIQDKIKTEWCLKNNFKLLRFWETDINDNQESIINILKQELK